MSLTEINSLKTLNEVSEYRRQMNEACDKRAQLISIYKKADELSNMKFGAIKEAFESISPALFKTSDGKDIMRRYSAMVKSSPNLFAMHLLYENIRKAGAESDIDFFINNLASENWGVDKKTIDEDCKKLGRILAEGYILVGGKDCFVNENKKLSDAVYYIAENKKTQKNIAEYSNAMRVIRESVNENKSSDNIFESENIDDLAKRMIDEFNKKYSSDLNEGEFDALKEICESDDREAVFNKYKESCESKLNEAKKSFEKEGNSAAIEKIDSILERVSSKKFSLDSVGSDICGMIELGKIFE